MEYLPYFISYFITLSLGVYSLTKRKSLTAFFMAFAAFSQSVQIHFFIYEAVSNTFRFKIFYDDIQFIALLIYFTLLLAFTFTYTKELTKQNLSFLILIGSFFSIMSVFKMIDSYDSYFRINKMVVFKNQFIELTYDYGFLSKITYSVMIAVSCYIFFLLLKNALLSKNDEKFRSVLIFISFLIQVLFALFSFLDIRIYNFRNNMPIAFGISSLFVFIAAFKYKALDYLPDFLNNIVQNFDDAIIVTDEDFLIIEHNRMAENLFKITNKRSIYSYSALSDIHLKDFSSFDNELTLKIDSEEYIFEIKTNRIKNKSDKVIGFTFIFHNITGLRKSELAIRKMRNNLETMVNDRVKDLKKEIENRIKAEDELQVLYNELRITQKEIMFTLSEVVESRSKETANHVIRVSMYSYLLAKLLGIDDYTSELIRDASPLHDVGKIAIPDSILHKPGILTDEEREVIKSHTKIGYDILSKSDRDLLKMAAVISLEHHEKYDGSGYPYGKKEDEISLAGRIVSIVDVLDALSTKRVYKSKWKSNDVISYILEQSGKQFDPLLVEKIIENIEKFLEISRQYTE